MNRKRVTFVMFGLMALIGLVYPQQFSTSSTVTGQKRRLRRVPAPPPTSKPRIDYSRFSHFTKKHQGACNTCHRVPTDNWKKVRDFPDIADYPGHDACVSCHRQQFFKGAKPEICSVCHSKISPRDDARFAFRNSAAARQFLIEFPHEKHQDVIASLVEPTVKQTVSLRAWAHSRFVSREPSQTNPGSPRGQPGWGGSRLLYKVRAAVVETKHYNNCEICHGSRTTAPAVPATGWIDSFVPDAATFRAVPTDHAACFNCHWKSQQPIKDNCAGCHRLGDKPYFLIDAPARLSLKFRHAREPQHTGECTTCHINITKASTLRGLKPDVPITSCSECHQKDGLRLDVSKELEALDKNRNFACSYCHTSDVGRRDAPASHYLIAGRAPLLRKDIK